jgi:hypothetical protein
MTTKPRVVWSKSEVDVNDLRPVGPAGVAQICEVHVA